MRTIVFPALRLLVWGVIAVALCVLAFGGSGGGLGGGEPAAGPGAPPLDLAEPVVPVGRGSVANTVTVTGTVVADAAVPVRATAAGKVHRLLAAPGPVAAGQPLVEIRWEEERDPAAGTDADGNPTVTPQKPRIRSAAVPAPAAGTLATDVLVDQIVAVGDRIGTVAPGSLSVTATLTQAEQFRLLSPPSTAQVEVQGGPAPFTCERLVLGAPVPGGRPQDDAGADPGTGDPGAGTGGGTTARCAVPPGTTVFAGMAASVVIAAGTAEDVLVVPVTAVQGSVQAGNVWVVGEDGEPVERPVTLGLTDGEQVEVRDGLAEGEQVLQFVPLPDDTPVDPYTGEPMTAGPFG
ncbi:hypothetical protein OF117_01575 [Geodermatophilus sp. YIM 151500]|uniref:hypothetical protein n=1 Tax=Geodermatophilus sp. YIM 151500 TaxID=2984531 RepID=UPI0021E4BE1D|nr:hypothetical protein [Geodermatophilus sp. YIM 151500]MCV2488039.1 hypothetical protein [Geodermatophilus sp. YIM 151500]